MAKIAVDVVLLLPDEVMTQAVAVNKKLSSQEISLNKNNCLPHISLLMGCLDEQDIPMVSAILQECASSYLPIPLESREIKVLSNSTGEEFVTWFAIEKTEALQSLHESLIEKLKPFLSYDASKEMFYKPMEVKESSVEYVNNFLKKASFENYSPHITIGYGSYEEENLQLSFQSSRLALCQLGNHCTCRKIVAEETQAGK